MGKKLRFVGEIGSVRIGDAPLSEGQELDEDVIGPDVFGYLSARADVELVDDTDVERIER